MFGYLVKSLIMHGSEICGWKEEDRFEQIQSQRYKWVLGLDKWMPKYIVLKES